MGLFPWEGDERGKKKNVKLNHGDFPGGAVDKNLPANAGDMGSIPGLGRFHIPQSNSAGAPQLQSLHPRARELQH